MKACVKQYERRGEGKGEFEGKCASVSLSVNVRVCVRVRVSVSLSASVSVSECECTKTFAHVSTYDTAHVQSNPTPHRRHGYPGRSTADIWPIPPRVAA